MLDYLMGVLLCEEAVEVVKELTYAKVQHIAPSFLPLEFDLLHLAVVSQDHLY